MSGTAPRRPARHGARPATARFAVVAARFNERIVTRLVDGALRAFAAGGLPGDRIDVHWVPGTFELPQAASHLAKSRHYAGIACLGVVIRGQTPHFEHVAREAASGIRDVALATGVPVAFGVVTALTEEQAWARAGGEVGNRGEEAAHAALDMAEFVAGVARSSAGSAGATGAGGRQGKSGPSVRPARRKGGAAPLRG